jgi:hypothetical protein
MVCQAVKRSRVKSKLRTQQTLERVNQLKTENEMLEEKIRMLTKELGFLKDLFLAHAGRCIHNKHNSIYQTSCRILGLDRLIIICLRKVGTADMSGM